MGPRCRRRGRRAQLALVTAAAAERVQQGPGESDALSTYGLARRRLAALGKAPKAGQAGGRQVRPLLVLRAPAAPGAASL